MHGVVGEQEPVADFQERLVGAPVAGEEPADQAEEKVMC